MASFRNTFRTIAFGVGLALLLMLQGIAFPVQVNGAGRYGPHGDDVPQIDEREIDTLRERIEEVQRRLQREDAATAEPGAPLTGEGPRSSSDYRDDVSPMDPQELEGLQKQIDELQRSVDTLERERSRTGGTASPPPATEPAKQSSPSQVEALERRITELERVLVGTEDKPGLAGLIGGWTKRNGFFLQSGNGDFFLRFTGLLQTDLRTFPGGQNGTNPGIVPSTFVLQRARFSVHGRLYRHFRFLITPDLGNGFTNSPLVNGRPQIFDGFVEWDQFPEFALRVGKFKNPIGLEMLQAPQNLSFMERSLVRNLIPNRDIGAMLAGELLRGRLEYELGVFNGAPSANFAQEGKAFSSGKELTARVFTTPFLRDYAEWLHGLGFGVATSYGSIRNTTGQDPMQTESFSYTFFQYNGNVTGNGDQIRVLPQMYWYWKRLGFMSQYVWTSQEERIVNGPAATLVHDAWATQASLFLTDDMATYGRVDPHRPFSITKPGYWGAWEIAARFAQINLDPASFSSNMASAATNAERARSTTVGLNWHLNYNIRLSSNFVHTDFAGATQAYTAASHEDALMFRVQLVY